MCVYMYIRGAPIRIFEGDHRKQYLPADPITDTIYLFKAIFL